MEKFFKVGVICSAHGVHGEVKVFPTTDDQRRFKRLKTVMFEENGAEIKVEGVKFSKQFVLLKLEGIDNMDDANKLRQKNLYVDRAHAVSLQTDEYFRADLLGMDIYNEENERIGTLKDVMETGANDVYEIELNDKSTFLLPAIKQCVLEVNVNENKMKIHILEGLLDE